jgi:CRP/FNR family cyclic AMP-dependent transcriptional regulator
VSSDFETFKRFGVDKKAGEIIFCEFEPGDAFYLIQSGKVKIVKVIGEVEKTIDILNPGEFFGEMALLEQAPRTATALALTDVKLLEFNQQNFDILMQGNPQIVLNILKIFSKRIYDQKRRFMILKLEEIPARVADVFLMLDENSRKPEDPTDMTRTFNTTPEDIAHWAGITVSKCVEVLNSFQAQRRVEISQGKIVVKNIADFQRFVNSRRRTNT